MVWSVEIPIYDAEVIFLVECSPEEADDALHDKFRKAPQDAFDALLDDIRDNSNCDGATCHNSRNTYYYMVYIRHVTHRNVSHELFHVVNMILMTRGISHDETAEPWAYLIGWLTERFYEDYSRIKKELRKTKK